jgi:SAM-dependent methyltransferase
MEAAMSIPVEYAIRGGIAGRERLRILARTLHTGTNALFDRLAVGPGMRCLDVGCGGGDVTFDLARRVGSRGQVVGVDIDQTKLDLARQEAAAQGFANIEFRTLDIRNTEIDAGFDLVYARFLLSHLAKPAGAIDTLSRALRPGGLLIVEDIDFKGSFAWPETAAFRRYCELYDAVVRRRGGDPDIGPRLPILLSEGGFEQIGMHVVQPMALQGEAKLINPITLENITDAILQDDLARPQEIDQLTQELYAFAADPHTVSGLARVIQAWGRSPTI